MIFMQRLLVTIVNISILGFEFTGVLILVFSGARGLYDYVRRDASATLTLAKGMSIALLFKLGGEILRTVIVKDIEEVLIVAFIIVLRAALSFLIRWEIRSEESTKMLIPNEIESPSSEK